MIYSTVYESPIQTLRIDRLWRRHGTQAVVAFRERLMRMKQAAELVS